MDWARIAWTAAVVVVVLVVALLLRWGWRNRAVRQSEFETLPLPPQLGEPLGDRLNGVYVSTTVSGQWQNRIVAHGAGRRARASLEVQPEGVLIDRVGEDPIWIPGSALVAVSTAPAIAGKVMGTSDGLVLITWTWSGVAVDTGFRADDRDRQAEWIDDATTLLTTPAGSESEVPE